MSEVIDCWDAESQSAPSHRLPNKASDKVYNSEILLRACRLDCLRGGFDGLLGDVLSVVSVSYPSSSYRMESHARSLISELETRDIPSMESSVEL